MRIKGRAIYAVAGAAALLTVAVYLTAVRNDFVNWDDYGYVVENTHIRSLDRRMFAWAATDLSTDFWLPVTWISHAVDYALWGLNPAGHHLTSVLLHGINTFLVALLVARLFLAERRRRPGAGPAPPDDRGILIAAGTTALLFGLHPLHVESVAWVSERKDLLSALFSLLALLAYVRHADFMGNAVAGRKVRALFFRSRYYYLCLALFLLALASKPMAVTLPAVFLLLDWYPLRRAEKGEGLAALIAEKALPALLACIVAALAYLAQKSQGTVISTSDVPIGDRVLVAAQAIVFYLSRMALPLHLLPVYPFPQSISLREPVFLLSAALVIGTTILCILLRRRRFFPTAWAFYVITLMPVLGLVKVGTVSMADRYTYFASLGPFLVAGTGAAWLWARADSLKARGTITRRALLSTAVVAVAALSFLTVRRIGVWRNSLTLWNYELANSAEPLPLAYNNRGLALKEQGRNADALEDYTAAIALNPQYSDPYSNRGILLDDLGRTDDAIRDFDRAIALDPIYVDNYRWRAAALRKKGLLDQAAADLTQAIRLLTQAIRLRPDDASLYVKRGAVFLDQGDPGRSVQDLNEAIALDPSSVEAYVGRGMAYKAVGAFDRAIADYDAAVRLRPSSVEAYNDRGVAYKHLGQFDRALADYDRAIELRPSFALAHMNRGVVLGLLGRYDRAIEDFTRTVELEPDFSAAWFFLGEANARTGRSGAALRDFRKACELGNAEGCAALRSPGARQ